MKAEEARRLVQEQSEIKNNSLLQTVFDMIEKQARKGEVTLYFTWNNKTQRDILFNALESRGYFVLKVNGNTLRIEW